MSEPITEPEWTLGWRLQRALAHANVNVEEMADELGISRSTVSRWLNDRGAEPRIGYLRLWALRTGVPFEWLVGVRTAPIRWDPDREEPNLCDGCLSDVHCDGGASFCECTCGLPPDWAEEPVNLYRSVLGLAAMHDICSRPLAGMSCICSDLGLAA